MVVWITWLELYMILVGLIVSVRVIYDIGKFDCICETTGLIII